MTFEERFLRLIGRGPDAPIRVKQERLVPFFRRLATMMKSGVNAANAFEFLAQGEDDPNLAEALELVTQMVMSGHTISSALASPRLKLVFDPTVIGMFRVGEQTGGLTEVAERLADLLEKQQRLRREVVSAMTYPAALLLVIGVVAAIFIVVLGPRDSGLFAMFDSELPWPTEVLVNGADVLKSPAWLGGALALLVGFCFWFRSRWRSTPSFRLTVDSLLLEIPLIGILIQKIESARMLYVIATATEVGIPMVRSLDLAHHVCGNAQLKTRFSDAFKLFRNGTELDEALERMEVFPQMVTSMIRLGLEAGSLDQILAKISVTYEEDVHTTLSNTTRMLEPLLLSFAGLLAGFLALATLLPIIEVANKL